MHFIIITNIRKYKGIFYLIALSLYHSCIGVYSSVVPPEEEKTNKHNNSNKKMQNDFAIVRESEECAVCGCTGHSSLWKGERWLLEGSVQSSEWAVCLLC